MKVFVLNRKSLFFLSLCVTAACAVLFGAAAGLPQTKPAASERLIPIYCVETEEKKAAITFDAAWGADDTQQILEILKKYNARCTFFAVGDWVRKYPDSVKAFYAAGHKIANHSDLHKMYSKLSYKQIAEDVAACNEAIEKVIGEKPLLLRAPSGDYNNDTVKAAESLGMYTVQWSVDSLDWQGLSVEEIVARVTSAVESGSIVLFHNDVKNTPQALNKVLETLSKQGYQFVPAEELIYRDNYRIDAAGRQSKNTI